MTSWLLGTLKNGVHICCELVLRKTMSDYFAGKIPFPRAISAKRRKQHKLFSPVVSLTRLRRIQDLIKCSKSPLGAIDGILCILGVDSRYNVGTKHLLNFLLFGYCELTPPDIGGSRITEEDLEDVVVVVKAESVHVYCNPLNYPYLLPFIAHWRNLHIHCMNSNEYEDDEDKAEEFKILSFISMVEGCNCLGIPYGEASPGDKLPPFDPFILEKWPLIQAFALEDFGCGGFFTMKHKAINITSELDKIYGLLDPLTVESIIIETLPLFDRHCKSVLKNVDTESDLSKVTERSLSEPIVSYFAHGHIGDRETIKSSSEGCQPYVLLGTHSSKQNIKSAAKQSLLNNNTTMANSGVDGRAARHMVCFAMEPKGTITCARTYFLENGFLPLSVVDTEKPSFEPSRDLRLLVDLYLMSISAVENGVKTFSQTFDRQKSYSTVLSELKRGIEERKVEVKSSFLSSNLEFSIEACDCLGRNVVLPSNKPLSAVKRACLYLYDVPSVEHPGHVLGSVVFGESFLDSAVRMLVPDNASVWNTSFVFLTESIPRFVSWKGDGIEKQTSQQIESFAKTKAESKVLGKQLLCGSHVFILSPANGWETGSLYVYEQGFVFVHPRFGVISLPISKFSRVQFYDKGSTTISTLLILTYHASIKENLPYYLINKQNNLVLALTPHSHIYRQFYSDVLHLWKENQVPSFPHFETLVELPDDLNERHSCLQIQLESPAVIQDLSSAEASMPDLKNFLCHLSASCSFADTPIASSDLPVVLGNKSVSEEKQSPAFQLLLTILTGVPGSGKDSLCLALAALAKENSKWVILQRPDNNSDPFDPKVLQESLTTTLLSQRRLHARLTASGRRLRVIVVTPGFTDVIDVVQAIKTHPDSEVGKCLKIGAVTCCVDPLNCFMQNRLTLPKLLEQCAQGWVNNVVFTSCLESQNTQLSLIQKLVRACNPDVAFILAKGGEVTRTPDVELILSDRAFDEDEMAQKRLLMCPGWSLGWFSSGESELLVNEISISLYGPLHKPRFVSNLKALHSPISYKGIRESGAIHSLRGHVCFSEEEPRKEVRVQWVRLSGVLRMNPLDSTAIPRPPSAAAQQNGATHKVNEYCIIFVGFNLQEQNLKDWLKTCCKPAPKKQKLKTRKDLSDKEVSEINAKHRLDPLPPGWFYNGSNYVSLTGEKEFHHPLLDSFLDSYLLNINENIEKQNIEANNRQAVDIFTRPSSGS